MENMKEQLKWGWQNKKAANIEELQIKQTKMLQDWKTQHDAKTLAAS